MSSSSVLDYVLYATYASEGLAICIGNGLLLLTIVMTDSLRKRKEMLIIGGLCTADLFFGLGTLLTNIYRVAMILAGLEFNATTAWSCMLMPQIFINNIGAQMTATMNLVVSIDRYIAVAYPISYRLLTKKYAWRILGAALFFYLLSSITMYTSSYLDAPIYSNYTRMCISAVFPRWYSLFQYTVITGAGSLSVIVYLFVFFAYTRHMRKITALHAENERQVNTQRRLTVTLGIITMSTLLFFIMPFCILTYYLYIVKPAPYAIPLAILTRVSAIVNIVIYVYRQREVRPGMWKILRCKLHSMNETLQSSVSFLHGNPANH